MVPPCCQLTVFILAAFAGGSCALPLPAPSDLRIEHLGGVGAAPVGLEAAGGPLRLWWALPSAPRALVQRAYELQLAQEGGWQASSQTIETSQSEAVPLPAGMDKLQADSAYAVRVRWWATSGPVGPNLEPSQWSQWLNFTTGLPTPEDWGGAAWLAAANSSRGDAASQLRTTFELDAVGSLEKVHLYVGSRGYYKCWINGHSASDHEQGHTTTFEVRTLYDTFVVSPELLQAGTNALGCTIAQGWYGDSSGGAMSDFVHTKSLILKLSLRYRNGTRASVLSSMADKGGRRWMAATGPWVRAKIFKGVSYDARQETPGWTTAEYSTAGSAVPWATAREDATAAPQMVLRSAMTPLIRHTQSFPAVNFTRVPQPDSGATQAEKALVAAAPSYSYLYDFGQNAAAQISIHVPPGALLLDGMTPTQTDAVVTFSLKFAETDQKGEGESGGSPITYVSTLGKIAAGGIDWQAHFTYYGFQFCTLTVSSNDSTVVLPAPTIDTLVSHFTHSDVDHGLSGIEFSRPLLNTIQRMTLYASKSNLLDVPTDCPTRERAGWTGDGGLTREVTSYNFKMESFYVKWLNDIGDSQATFRQQCMAKLHGRQGPNATHTDCDCSFRNCTGEVPPAAPWYQHGYHGGDGPHDMGFKMPGTDPAWGMAFTSISHHMLTWFGDLEAVRRHYPGLQLYIEYLSQIPGVDPVVAPFQESGLLTYNVYADWDRPVVKDENVLVAANSSLVPNPTRGPRGTPSPLISSWVMIKSLSFMVDIAEALGHADDAATYTAMAHRSATAFLKAYLRVDGDGLLTAADGSLTLMSANALALDIFQQEGGAQLAPLLTATQRTALERALYRDVVRADSHSIAGIIGQAPLFPMLSRAGSPLPLDNASMPSPAALALQMNTRTTYPSFGHEAAQGATTLWEKFEGTGGTHNHIMFGTQSAWYYSDLAGIQQAPYNASVRASGWQRLILKPAVSCEYLSADLNLTSVTAKVMTSRGLIQSSWQLISCPVIPAPPPPAKPQKLTCAVVLEKDKYQPNTTGEVTLNCGAGVIDAVTFANFGTPTGSCETGFSANASCTDSDPEYPSKAIVEKLCLAKHSCTLEANVIVFGNQCFGVPKRLAVQVTCKASANPPPPTPPPAAPLPLGPRHFDWHFMIPGGSTARVHVPLLATAASKITITSSIAGGTDSARKLVYKAGSFVAGVDGVLSATVVGDSVAFECASGEYDFQLREI